MLIANISGGEKKKRKRTENELEHKVGRKWQVEHLLILQDKFWTIQDLFFGTYLVLSGGIEIKRFEPLVIKWFCCSVNLRFTSSKWTTDTGMSSFKSIQLVIWFSKVHLHMCKEHKTLKGLWICGLFSKIRLLCERGGCKKG